MEKKDNAIRNVKLVFMSQTIVLIVSVIRTILIPKFLTVEDHGYWQTYLLYVSYISIFYLGFNDGVYIRYAKMKKEEYIKNSFSSSIFVYFVCLLIEMAIAMLGIVLFANQYKAIYILVLVNVPITGVFGAVTYYLQLTGQMKKYTISVILEKAIFVVLLLIFVLLNKLSPYLIMILDIMSVALITIILCIKERDVVCTIVPNIKKGIIEYKENIKIGSKIMIGTYIALLFSGICKFFISATAEIEQFSYYAFAVSVTNVVIVCIGAMGMALYPQITKQDESKYGYYFNYINKILNKISPLLLALYYIGSIFINIILPKYQPSIKFFGLLFVVVLLQVKINVLNNTFYKILRQEKKMVIDNLVSLIQLIIGCVVLKDIYYIIYWQILVMTYRVIKTRYSFKKIIEVEKLNFVEEILSYLIYMVTLVLPFNIGAMVYAVYIFMYALVQRRDLIDLCRIMLLNKKNT